MEKLEGIKSENLGFQLTKLGDLLYEEGPILSHFANDRNEDFLFYWVDSDDNYHRWMLFKTAQKDLHSFFKKEITILGLIKSTPDKIVYFVNIDQNADYKNILISPIESIPTTYLPSPKSYFSENQFEQYALDLKNYLQLYFDRVRRLNLEREPSLSVVAEPVMPYLRKK